MKTKKEKIDERTVESEISDEMKKSYLDYAMSVIVSRAIPSIEDGLKPVQRRILYAMQQMGIKPNTQTKKSARVVGDVIGKYHPHGDSAVYEAMVRMAQTWSLRYPLVYGQGNFGSIDGDSPAAMRYTEAKMMPIVTELLQDLEKETVKFAPNYDGSLKEPLLLPGKLPSLILNGATGIAVGMSTNIPPHNLNEICDAIIAYLKNPEISFEELTEIVKGPDFPTGGSVAGEIENVYKTGRGRLTLQGKTTTEKVRKKDAVIITEVPYMVNKADLVEQIANLVMEKKIKNVSDLRDESSKGKIRVVLELKKGANPKFVINALYKYTRMRSRFSALMLALVNGQPKVLNLKNILEEYVKYREKIITRRTEFELKKSRERKEIVSGLIIALKNIDEIINLIKKAENTSDASEKLMKKYDLSKRQSQAILDTKLQQLTSLEQNKLKKELEELNKNIAKYEKILANIKEVEKIIIKELEELKKNYGDDRRTRVLGKVKDIVEKDLVQKKDVIVTITEKGYCKRMDVSTYHEQRRGGKGIIGSKLASEDFVRQIMTCDTHDYLMFFTTRGRVLWLKAYEVPEAKRQMKGKSLANLLNLRDEEVTNVISVKNFEGYLFMATKLGKVKKISLKYFSKPRRSGLKAIKLPEDNSDKLIDVQFLEKDEQIFLATRNGRAIKFDNKEVREMSRASYGVTGIKLDKGDEVVSLGVLRKKAILTISENGYGKRTGISDYRRTSRAGKGIINMKLSPKTGKVVTTVSVDDKDGIIITTAKGLVMRTSLKNIRVMGRATQGVRIVKLKEKDYVTDLVRIDAEEIKDSIE